MGSKLDRMAVGARLKAAREVMDLTQTDVGAKIGATPSQLSRFEHGERLIPADLAAAFAAAYGFDLNFLYTGSEAGLSRETRAALSELRRKSA